MGFNRRKMEAKRRHAVNGGEIGYDNEAAN